MKKLTTRQLATYAILVGLAYIVMLVRIPIFAAAPFLKLDFKDVILALGGIMFGPVPAALMAVTVALLEMVTVSESFLYGFFMNALSSIVFVCISSYIARKGTGWKSKVFGFIVGILCVTAVMMLWNYILTPWYMQVPRDKVVPMLMPIILPFNLIKYSVNAAATLILLNPVSSAVQRVR